MIASDDLFELICALNQREKQCFVLAAQGKETTYIQLFQALGRLKQYDENAFLGSQEGRGFERNYPVRKKELFEKILTVCRSQRQVGGTKKSIDIQIREKLEDVRILRAKGLQTAAHRRLKQVLKQAQYYEIHEVLIEALRLERFLVVDREAPGYIQKTQAIHASIQQVILALANKYDLLELKDRLFLVIRQFADQTGQFDQAYLDAVIADPALQDIQTCLSFEAKVNFYLCHSIYCHLSNNIHGAWAYFRKIYFLWQENLHLRRLKMIEYRNSLQNYLAFCNAAGQYDDFDTVLEDLEAGPFHSQEEEATTIFNAFNVRMMRYLHDVEWEKLLMLEKRFVAAEKRLSKAIHPSRSIVFALHFAWIHFVLEDFEAAISWLNKIDTVREEDMRQGLVYRAKMLEILVLFEQGEIKTLENRSRAMTKAFAKFENEHSFELQFVKTLNRFAATNRDAELFQQLSDDLAFLKSNGSDKLIQYIITVYWIRSKINNQSLKEVLEQDVNAKAE